MTSIEDAPRENVPKYKTPAKVKGCYQCSERRIDCDRAEPCLKCTKTGRNCSGNGYEKGRGKRGRDNPNGPSGISPNGASTNLPAQPQEVEPPIQALGIEVEDVGYFQPPLAQSYGHRQEQIQNRVPPLPIVNQVAAPVNVGFLLNYFSTIVTFELDNTTSWGALFACFAHRDSLIMSAIEAVSTAHIESRGQSAFAQQYWARAMVALESADTTHRAAMALLILCLPIDNTVPSLEILETAMRFVYQDLGREGVDQGTRDVALLLWRGYVIFYLSRGFR